jgi:hypothetical protein
MLLKSILGQVSVCYMQTKKRTLLFKLNLFKFDKSKINKIKNQ